MKQNFLGWNVVAQNLKASVSNSEKAISVGELSRLNEGQCRSLNAIASRIAQNSVLIADEVGMGKTRIATEVAKAVVSAGGRVAILVPPGLGYQWQEELSQAEVASSPLIRSLYGYFSVWDETEGEVEKPWFDHSVILLSHVFTNWRLSDTSGAWRWGLLPEMRRLIEMPNSRRIGKYSEVFDCAKSIVDAIPKTENNAARILASGLLKVDLSDLKNASKYGKNTEQRKWLERCIGLGIGLFDLVIIDEAHKSRGSNSGLSNLLSNVVHANGSQARRLGMTATPVELEAAQWWETLERISVDRVSVYKEGQKDPIEAYEEAVKRVRQVWRSSEAARNDFKRAASEFQKSLSPYLIRRDKREDAAVQTFEKASALHYSQYRLMSEIKVKIQDLTPSWKRAICAAESLSVAASQSEDSTAQRIRLTLGNGHGIASLLDRFSDNKKLEATHALVGEENSKISKLDSSGRVKWWLEIIEKAFEGGGDQSIFEHPALLACVKFIETKAAEGQKVLVFGKFTRPLRALTDLLDARMMLRFLSSGQHWPISKVHNGRDEGSPTDKWPAVRAAYAQLSEEMKLGPLNEDRLNERLKSQYAELVEKRASFRNELIRKLKEGFEALAPGSLGDDELKAKHVLRAIENSQEIERNEDLNVLTRAILGLNEGNKTDLSNSEIVLAFCALIRSASDRDDSDADADGDGVVDDEEAAQMWASLRERLHVEYANPEGGFARLMYGGTLQSTRRMLQLAFNRQNSFPQVLVAQSMVGREGLNLHEACRTVVLLHPEWNPGVVEQQIGRIDRVGSRWEKDLFAAIADGKSGDELPRIEVSPVIFEGTYDEHNWTVLKERWADLRAQLHGVIITETDDLDDESKKAFEEIASAAPNFNCKT